MLFRYSHFKVKTLSAALYPLLECQSEVVFADSSVADPKRFDSDPDPAFHLDSDPEIWPSLQFFL